MNDINNYEMSEWMEADFDEVTVWEERLLPSGDMGIVVGDVEGDKQYTHRQGERSGFNGTCGIVSCETVLRQFGHDVSESELVEYAAFNGLCALTSNPETSGGTTLESQAQLLREYNIPAHWEQQMTMADIAQYCTEGRGVILALNAGVLWNSADYYDRGNANHAVSLTGVAYSTNGEIAGFYINDSGTGEGGRFVDQATLYDAWQEVGGNCVVTDVGRGVAFPGSTGR